MIQIHNINHKNTIRSLAAVVVLAAVWTFIACSPEASANSTVSFENLAEKGYSWTQSGNAGVDVVYCNSNQRDKTGAFVCNSTGSKKEKWVNDIKVRRAGWIRSGDGQTECWLDGMKKYRGEDIFVKNSKTSDKTCSNMSKKISAANDNNGANGWHFPLIFRFRVHVNSNLYNGYGYCTSRANSASNADDKVTQVKYRVVKTNVKSAEPVTTTDAKGCETTTTKKTVTAKVQVTVVTESGVQNIRSDWRNDEKYSNGSITITKSKNFKEKKGCDTRPGNVELSANIDNDTLYAGESNAQSSFTADIEPNETKTSDPVTKEEKVNKKTTKKTTTTTETQPDGHNIYAVHFLIPDGYGSDFAFADDKDFDAKPDATGIEGVHGTKGLCPYLRERLGANAVVDCSGLASWTGDAENNQGDITSDGELYESNTINSPPRITPDRSNAGQSAVGGKYCVASVSNTVHREKITTVVTTITNGSKKTAAPKVEYKRTLDLEHTPVSNIECRPIAKKPYYQVENSSVFSDGNITSSSSNKRAGSSITAEWAAKFYSPWSEYLAVGNGVISNTASGAKSLNGVGGNEFSASDLSPLTIANRNTAELGKAGVSATNYAKNLMRYLSNHSDLIITDNAVVIDPDEEGANDAGNTKTISGIGDFTNGRTIIVNNGDVVIGNDISTGDVRFRSGNDVKQYIIISTTGNINISGSVRNIDAWLIAPNGNINTCFDEDLSNCTNQLTINGLVAAKSVSLDRSYGIEYPGQEPAEKIIFDPAAYLWSYRQASSQSGQANTVFTRELAPRK